MSEYADILSALDRREWPALPQKIEMSHATLHIVKQVVGSQSMTPVAMPSLGVPVYVDESVPRGQARVSWQDGRTEMIGKASDG